MLEKPTISDQTIIASANQAFGLPISQLTFLPLGADLNSAVYRAETENSASYFVKLKWGQFNPISVTLASFLSKQGISEIIAPLPTRSGQFWHPLATCTMVIYPFVNGKDGYETALSADQWTGFGRALKRVHSTNLPEILQQDLPRETYSSCWRDALTQFMKNIQDKSFSDSIAISLANFLFSRRDEIFGLLRRTNELAGIFQRQKPELTVCHADLHAGNLLLGTKGSLHIVDWDNPIMAPRERDLMSIGAGLFGRTQTPEHEILHFFDGYGSVSINRYGLSYYRYERIIADLAVECEQILLETGGRADREQAYSYLTSNFLPGHTLELARQADPG